LAIRQAELKKESDIKKAQADTPLIALSVWIDVLNVILQMCLKLKIITLLQQ
jgi:hypothetical protein